MAETYLPVKLIEIFEGSTVMQAELAKDPVDSLLALHLDTFNSIDAIYPLILIHLREIDSEEKRPAGRGILTIEIWINDSTAEAFKIMKTIKDEVINLINRNNGSPFDEVDFSKAPVESLRVVHCLKFFDEWDYDDDNERRKWVLQFNTVKSEGEKLTSKFDRWVVP